MDWGNHCLKPVVGEFACIIICVRFLAIVELDSFKRGK